MKSGEEFSAADFIERAYQRSRGDPDFSVLLAEIDAADDDQLGELIEADGRWRVDRGLPVSLHRYIPGVPDLAAREVPLDAAIDVTLRSLSGGSRISPKAVDSLVQKHPQWATAIHEAAALSAAVLSTTGLRRKIESPPTKPLPFEFGPMLPSGQRRYVLEELLGHGAFGQVYLGRDRQLSEEGHAALVAIKILLPADRTPFDRQRLIEEATKVRRISHPNVVMVLDRGVSDENEDYIVYEYVDGGDLDDRIGREPQPWPSREAAALMAQVARGIHAAHSAGVIHCDLKPGNIMMTSAAQPKVTDFGVAKRIGEASQGGAGSPSSPDNSHPIGNVAFISPEQFRGETDAITVQADVYSMGGILFHLLSGILPNGSTPHEIARRHSDKTSRVDPPSLRDKRPDIDRDLESIVHRSLAPDAVDRYASAAAMAEDLERWQRHEPLGWNHPRRWHLLQLWIRRKPGLAVALASIVLLSLVGGLTALHFMSIARQRRLEYAVAQARLDEQKLAKVNQDRFIAGLAGRLMMLQSEYRINVDILPQIWYTEYLLGPKVLDIPEAQTQLWQNRVKTIRWFVDDARMHGRAEAMETLLWESALAFWLVGGGDHAEAEPLLAENIDRWKRKLDPDDQWLADLETIRLCAAVNRMTAISRNAGNSAPKPINADELRVIESALALIDHSIPDDHRGTPLHYLLLDRLTDLQGPALLNNPARAGEIQKVKTSLLKKKK